MSRASKCDLCGKLYEPYNYYGENGVWYPNSITLTSSNMFSIFGDKKTVTFYDLCPNCLVAIGICVENLKYPDDGITPEIFKKNFNLPVESVEGE